MMTDYERINSEQLARRLGVRESWVREHCRERAVDRIPHLKLGRNVVFEWGHHDLEAWIEKHRVCKPTLVGA